MDKILFIIAVFSLGCSIFLFTTHFIKYGISEGFTWKTWLMKSSIVFFMIYLISFVGFFIISN